MLLFLAPSMRVQARRHAPAAPQVMRALMLVGTTGLAMACLSHHAAGRGDRNSLRHAAARRPARRPAARRADRRARAGSPSCAGFRGMLLVAPARRRHVRPGHRLARSPPRSATPSTRSRRGSSRPPKTPDHAVLHGAVRHRRPDASACPGSGRGPRPTPLQALMIASLGVYGGTGHFLLIRAFRHRAGLDAVTLPLCAADLGDAVRQAVLPPRPGRYIDRRHGDRRRRAASPWPP